MTQHDNDEVSSPCMHVCTLDEASGLCLGCARTMEEIASWEYLSNDEKRTILGELPERKHALYTNR